MEDIQQTSSKDSSTTSNTDSFDAKVWPGAFGIYKTSKDAVMLNIVPIVQLYVVNTAGSIVLRFVPRISTLLSTLFSIFTGLCIYQIYLAGVNKEKSTLNEVVEKAWKLYLSALVLYILIGLTFLSFFLFIIPGFFIFPRVLLAPYFLIDKKLDPIEAYKASWHATKGHLGKMYGMLGVVILMILPSITIIGILATIYLLVMYSATGAILYQHLVKQKINLRSSAK